MQFLMELIDSYSLLRGQILLIEPLPSINKVFSLVVQNERQRDIFVVSLSVETTAFFTRSQNQSYNSRPPPQKDKPTCSHYGFVGHTIKKCYKLHDYPPSYKFQTKPAVVVANLACQSPYEISSANSTGSISAGSLFTMEQCKQLLSLLPPSSQYTIGFWFSSQPCTRHVYVRHGR